ncbi:hypothetical protein PHAVU_L004701 [Phaseolus vulgaris]|uniref:Uncharacterized protein n=2 Tax=Phaseolus vulgaris TaxID=3885 RepID=A0ACC3P210_PHAVU|nr:hypothetical protein PHAVU_001G082400g [Phaseolus vulgaris]ESW33582.1 hypothetical protein PHAVU_001G082400g [Phaseolus vulgaris]
MERDCNKLVEIVTVKIEVEEKCNRCRMLRIGQRRGVCRSQNRAGARLGRVQHMEGTSSGLGMKKVLRKGGDKMNDNRDLMGLVFYKFAPKKGMSDYILGAERYSDVSNPVVSNDAYKMS